MDSLFIRVNGHIKTFLLNHPEATAGGPAHQGIINLAYDIYKNMPGVFRFTAFNDLYHKGKNSKHAVGLALDYTLKDRSQYAIQEKQLVAMFKKFGIGAKVIDGVTDHLVKLVRICTLISILKQMLISIYH